MDVPQHLPELNIDYRYWQLQGACHGVDSSMFFCPDGERGRVRTMREQRAKQMCRSCPVLNQCRTHALATAEPYGVWGGLSEADRDRLLRRNAAPGAAGTRTRLEKSAK
ncbi:MAG: WhiB family transcriptional regulator [Mycobacterium sp.]